MYPHGNRTSAPDAIGRELGRRLEARYKVVYYDWFDRDVIHPEPGDVLLGHPHPDPRTVFRRSARQKGWRRRLMLSPFLHGDLRQIAFLGGILPDCDLYLAITGPYWYQTIQDSHCSHWLPKMIHLDLAINRGDYPPLKTRFGTPGKRRVVYIGHTGRYKNTPYLSEIAARLPEADFAWMGSGGREIPGFTPLGNIDLGSKAGKDLAAQFDFMLTVGSADANPTTILEAMAWGLIPICTPTSGYAAIPSIPNVPLNDAEAAAAIVRSLLSASEPDLLSMQSANWQLLDDHYTWDRFAAQVVEAIESTESPALAAAPMKHRLALTFCNLTSIHGPIASGLPGRAVRRIGRR